MDYRGGGHWIYGRQGEEKTCGWRGGGPLGGFLSLGFYLTKNGYRLVLPSYNKVPFPTF